jgi:dipeptidase E
LLLYSLFVCLSLFAHRFLFLICQCFRFKEAGCVVLSLDLIKAHRCDGSDGLRADVRGEERRAAIESETAEARRLIDAADVILVSGGNTLFAVDTWQARDIPAMLRQASGRGAVMCGGSAGAICWFDGGHSDSADPESYFVPRAPIPLIGQSNGEEVNYAQARSAWQYIRVPGISLLPGLCCPHHDRTQSNGVLRATDFDAMLRRHQGERGVAIDHWAALLVDGDSFRVLGVPGKSGSVKWAEVETETETEQGLGFPPSSPSRGSFDLTGQPGVWIKQADAATGAIIAVPLPSHGRLSDYLEFAEQIVEDPNVAQCRRENPHL